uniref:G protein-coupled receptor 184 n=1 Tax=Hucho hucho TaxID=62062 RepID=A0A4W5K7I3_9TELE
MEKQMDNLNLTCVTNSPNPISDFLMGIYILAFILGLAFNLLTLGPIVQQVRSQNVLGVFLLNLSLSDLLYIFTMPLWINYYHLDHRWSLGSLSCSVAGFFYYSNMYLSIYLLCCISVDRCLAVTYPLRTKAFRSMRYAWMLCLVVCVAVMSAHGLVLFKNNLQDAHNDTQDRCYETYPMPKPMFLFNLLRVGIGFLLPMLVLGLCYWRILGQVNQSKGLGEQVKRKVRLLTIGVMVIFSVCFAPYHLLLLTRSLAYYHMDGQRYCKFEDNMRFPFSCTLALSSLNSVVDPVLYVLVSNGLREDMRLSCCGNRKSQRERDRSVITTAWKTHTSLI